MNIDQFWNIVEQVHAASPQDMDAKCELLGQELRRLPPSEVQSFKGHFSELWYRAYNWEVWDAAYIINGGCSDDGFMDFRAALISLGRSTYEEALKNADSLADVEIGGNWSDYEGYQYVAPEVYLEMTGNEVPRSTVHPREPSGVKTEEWEFGKRYPKLAAKFGHNDEDLAWMKERAEKESARDEAAKQLLSLMLNARLIPANGLIPPMSVLTHVLRTGYSPASTGLNFSWAPMDMDEPLYWRTVLLLEKMPPSELARWPDLQATILRQDLGYPNDQGFDAWMQSLNARGLL